ncbi:MAG TPA: mevalonate kinase, partial [Archaeoglobaceae archaeon]|nr:mevalonate kinase [Archaeoglobaceae archaeon]
MIASAPGKVILFGEHAVVYGRHAIVTAINRRCYADVKKSSKFSISSSIATTGLDFEKHPYVSFALKRFMEFKQIMGAEIKIRSDIPISSGLGSSAAVTISVLKALDAEFEAGLSDEVIYEVARKVELDVQGRASGTDPFISTYGGSWLIPEREQFEIRDLGILVIDSQQYSVTS